MLHRPVWAPDDIDIERPAPARMYDYYLGGSHNFAADRELSGQAMAVWPDSPHIARANRALLRRIIAYLDAQGIRECLGHLTDRLPESCLSCARLEPISS